MLIKTAAADNLVTLGRLLLQALPGVSRELGRWGQMAGAIPRAELREQALASLALKKFHCQGGSIYSIRASRRNRELLQAIIALQTISDYLDNLCDRAGILEEKAFQRLHLAFTDALLPGNRVADYYACYPSHNDGGYLQALVETCRKNVVMLPAYRQVQEAILDLARLYCTLQTLKHIDRLERRQRLQKWLEPLLAKFSSPLYWWELAAATGSTLGIFALLALAARERVTAQEVTSLKDAYFPWIGGLHILLDYFIDQQEDREGGDLNFCAFYQDSAEATRRLQFFLMQSLEKARHLPDPAFHLMVIRGLPALYLSDCKVAKQEQEPAREMVLRAAGPWSYKLFYLCRTLRGMGII
ncbi:MAG: tetraprenyl-beta-curcumene synthase family protein [Moorella sp. (in: Bacteria)]|nr:tetraprenyl-beta-curcumene synthase family protein [Moorella sp. (in: firmicutes)]